MHNKDVVIGEVVVAIDQSTLDTLPLDQLVKVRILDPQLTQDPPRPTAPHIDEGSTLAAIETAIAADPEAPLPIVKDALRGASPLSAASGVLLDFAHRDYTVYGIAR